MKFPSLMDLVKYGIPGANRQPSPATAAADKKAKRAAKQAAAEAKRQAVYDLRARRCAAELRRVAGLMTAAEFARYGHRLNMAAKTALKQKSSSRDLRLDLGDILPLEIAQRAGLPVDADAVPVAKNWERRAYPANLVADTQPAASGDLIVTPEMIINAAAKARGNVKPDQKIDPGRAIKPSDRLQRK
jgi:hypothetical protein